MDSTSQLLCQHGRVRFASTSQRTISHPWATPHLPLEESYLNLPEITLEEISDKSKANLLAKALVCLQTGWFVVQCFGRLGQGLPLTTLELLTISHVWCTWAIYAQWLKKTLDVTAPTVLRSQASTAEFLRNAGPAASKPYRQTPLDFVWDGHVSWTLDVRVSAKNNE